ncbi:DUF1396 domain-containing protein [Streptomyces sp. NPDC005574]|uniref:DUF1396 domain-containing protein n=1 Tax=Streptomyces sp. NPDC005574 TaxID=3156891 RepID=UPI0033B2E63F
MKTSVRTSVRPSVRRRTAGAGLAALVLAGGVAGCAKGDDDALAMEPAAAVAKAAKNAETITSFCYTMTGRVPDAGRVSGEAAMSVKPLAMSMKMTAAGKAATAGKVEIRLVGKAMYIGGGAQAAKEMDGKSWIKFDMSALGADKKLNPAQLGAGQADQNPATESTFLTGSKNVKKVGTETVDGVETTHYKGTVTVAEIEASLKGKGKATREAREKSLKQYEKMGIDSLAMDMWIDGDDHTKKFRMRGDADKGPLDMTITFLDINKPVTVTAPPAKDTVDLAEMMKGTEG